MTTTDLPWQNLGDLVREQAAQFGDRTLFRFEGVDLTFAQVEEQTNRLANVLHMLNIHKGDKVAVMLPNGLDFPVTWLALAKVGAIMVPVNTRYQERDLHYILQDSGAVLALTHREQIAILQRVVALGCPDLRMIGALSCEDVCPPGVVNITVLQQQAAASYALEDVVSSDLVNLQYTSGTTGFPKGCMLTHEYWLRLGQIVAQYLNVTASDINLTAQPFYYMDPQWNTILCLMTGIPLVILPRFSASTFWQSVQKHGVTFFYLLGTMPIFLLKQPEDPSIEKNHRVRVVLCSGIVPQLHATYEARWNVVWREAYGMTETGVDLCIALDDSDSVGTGRVGRPISTKEVHVVNAEGRALPDGEVGEIVVRGQPMMQGYYKKPQETAEILRGGWLHTGDLAYRDAQGYFYLVGRLKDMIRRSGENIATAEVEAVLCEHPGVYAAAVVPVPDELRGEEVKALIQLLPGKTSETVSPQILVDFVCGKLAAFKAPRFIEYVTAFPLTPSERIAKHKLADLTADQRLGTYDVVERTWS